MRKRAMRWRRAAAMGWRDLRSAPGKFGFVVLSVAVGVAALVGVRGFSDAFRQTLSVEARALMAGDLSARQFRPATEKERQNVQSALPAGSRTTWVTETISMAGVEQDPVPILVSLKAVDPAEYPYYGKAVLEPRMSLQDALAGDSAIVADEFLVRLNAHVGDTLRLGGRAFRIAAVLKQEPDRITAGAGIGPRVMISQAALGRTGLLSEGSRATERLLVQLPASANAVALRKPLEAALPDAQVMDYREGNPALTDGLDHATAMLSLICLVAMVLGAIGVAMAMHAHLEQRMEMLAILKAMGASASDLLRIFLLQTMGLGLAGALLGVAAGVGLMRALPAVFGTLLPIHAVLSFPWKSSAMGLGTGLLTTLLFCLPPLLDVRNVRPVLVLRRLVEQSNEGWRGWLIRLWARRLQLALALPVVAALAAIAWALSDSAKVGAWFAVFLAGALLVLLALAAVALFALRRMLKIVRLRLPSTLRHGLANLYRPGNQSAAVLASLGTGVMLILSVFLMQGALLRELRNSAAPSLPNLFLIDVTTDEAPGLQAFFQRQPGVKQALELMPVVTGRFVALHGVPVEQLHDRHYPQNLLRRADISWADALPEGDKLKQGQWWTSTQANEIAMHEGVAERLGLSLGQTVELEIGGQTRTLRLAAIFHNDGEHLRGRISFFVPSGLVKDEPATWYGGVRVDPARILALERALFIDYPTVTVINLAEILDRIETIVDQVTFVVRFLAGFSIFAGLMILASSVASTRFRRMREAVVLKTLGASRGRIVRTYSVEFSVLGLLAGAVGVLFANLLTRLLLDRMSVPYHVDLAAAATALLGTALLAAATGWLASYRLLGLRPLEVLREE